MQQEVPELLVYLDSMEQLEQQDLLELPDQLVGQEQQDWLEHLEQLEQQDLVDQLVIVETPETLEQRDSLEQQVLQDPRAPLAYQVLLEVLVQQDCLDQWDHLDQQDQLAILECRVPQVERVVRVPLVLLDQPDSLEVLAQLE